MYEDYEDEYLEDEEELDDEEYEEDDDDEEELLLSFQYSVVCPSHT